MNMIVLTLLGLAAGSFINAAVWRLHESGKRPKAKDKKQLSIISGRSVCPNCRHQLTWLDLVPVLSWLWLKGRCRYCQRPISVQYPLVELLTGGLFLLSYLEWDFVPSLAGVRFGVWLVLLTGLLILAVYDLKWMMLPDKVMRPLIIIALAQLVLVLVLGEPMRQAAEHLLAAMLAGGFFYALFGVSKGRWMGGGDVKLAFLMGLILAVRDTLVALVLAFNVAAFLSVGLIISRRLSRKSLIPFGPFLIGATIIAQLYGQEIFQAYLNLVTIY